MAQTFVDTVQKYRGDDWVIPVRITYRGAATNITGFAFRFTLKRTTEESDADALFEADNQGGMNLSLSDPVQGLLEVRVPAAITATLLPGFIVGDLQMTTASPNVITITPYKVIIENIADVTITEP